MITVITIVLSSKVKAEETNITERARIFATKSAELVLGKAKSLKSEKQFIDFLRTELNNMVAVNYMSLWVLGKNRINFSKEQIDSFVKIFSNNIVLFYGKIIYSNKDKIFGLNKVFSNNDNMATVEFDVKLDKNNLLVDWQVRHSVKENKLLVTDFIVNGVSFLQAKRTEYSGLFESTGKDPEKFLNLLRKL